MKISATLFLASVGSTSAFVAPVAKSRCLPLQMSDKSEEKGYGFVEKRGGVGFEAANLSSEMDEMDSAIPKNVPPKKSKSIPFVNCPVVLDGNMGGDVGFDPLGFSKTSTDLANYREAEIKHARLAMLAAAGWPISELFDKKIATVLGLAPALDAAGRVPSVLNGGMGKISPFYWGACILVAAAIDAYGFTSANKKAGYIPGDLGFDPFGLYPKDEKGKKWMQTAEIKNGRLAMIAITAFAAQEFVSHVAIIDETPFFFKPIWQTLSDSANNGYYIPPLETPTILDAVTAPLDAAVTTSAETATAAMPPVEAVSVAPVEAAIVNPFAETASAPLVEAAPVVSPPLDNEELVAAKKKIAELEAQIAEISTLTR
mmetsp:Transcript_26770/g.32854  ORF Transcript_26770/g.32854 Transcript_26770/m.32854 type:complete len:372 (+) Transcript_26770:38-1153(+)